jgi:threonyl-tRNA synthetase
MVDHRRLGRELELFHSDPLIGAGLPIWLPDGAAARRAVEERILDRERRSGYQHVISPPLGKRELYELSGHLEHFAADMFPPMRMSADDELMLRPSLCPHHALVFRSRGRSYRELPLRIAELGGMFRAERSGVLGGLSRVRSISLNDGHTFCASDQVAAEVERELGLIRWAHAELGVRVSGVRLSLRGERGAGAADGNRAASASGDPGGSPSGDGGIPGGNQIAGGNRAGSASDGGGIPGGNGPADGDGAGFVEGDAMWARAEAVLREALERAGIAYVDGPGEAAFYGPKIDIQVRDDAGREQTLSTVQVDYGRPHRFGLEYVAADGSRQVPVMIHRSLVGSMERLFAHLIEVHSGAFPVWYAPVQVEVLPVGDGQFKAADAVRQAGLDAGLRVALAAEGSLSSRVRRAAVRKVPYVAVVGEREAAAGEVALRRRDGSELAPMPVADALALVARDAAGSA